MADRDQKVQGRCLASWDMICRPKEQGGLGVLNLRVQNQALLLKNLYKFYNHMDIPWVNLLRLGRGRTYSELTMES